MSLEEKIRRLKRVDPEKARRLINRLPLKMRCRLLGNHDEFWPKGALLQEANATTHGRCKVCWNLIVLG